MPVTAAAFTAATTAATLAVALAVPTGTTDVAAQPTTPSCATAPRPAADEHWVASWSTAPSDATIVRPFAEQTIRQVVTPLLDGTSVRLRLQHRYGTAPVTVTDVAVGRQLDGPSLVADSICGLAFDGDRTVTIPPGGEVVSDPFRFDVERLTRLAIDLHVVGASDQTTRHFTAFEEPYVTPFGNSSGEPSGDSFMGSVLSVENSWHLLGGLDVVAPQDTGLVVAFGDSITDGFGNTAEAYCVCDPPPVGTDGRYPDFLARRLAAAGVALGVANAGIGGNELLAAGLQPQSGPPGMQRYPQDVLAVPGATHAIVMIGTNDIGNKPDTDVAELLAAYEQLVTDMQAHGLHVTLGTIPPAGGTVIGENPFGIGILHGTPEANVKRERVNEWIRGNRVSDEVVDFDACLRDPDDPGRLRPAYDSGDHLHPNAAGYAAMADCVELSTLTAPHPAPVPVDADDDVPDPTPAVAQGRDLPATGGGGLAAAALAAAAVTVLRRAGRFPAP